MNICVINGKNAKGTTYKIASKLLEKLDGNVTEFFLPKDFSSFCLGCRACFTKDYKHCPHYEDLNKITEAMDKADILIFTSPVYVYHITGALKSFLDHYGHMWMAHKPMPSMFKKKAVIISTAAGLGQKGAIKDVDDSLFYFGVPLRYKMGYAVKAENYDKIDPKLKRKIDKDVLKVCKKLKRKTKMTFKTKMMFNIFRMLHKKGKMTESDRLYWQEKGWLSNKRPWK